MTLDKSKIHDKLCARVAEDIEQATTQLDELKEARNSETKSTAGDKHETAREMAQQSINRVQESLDRLRQMDQILHRMNPERKSEEVALGSLLRTDSSLIYVAVAYGSFQYDNETIMAVSPQAPLIQAARDVQPGEQIRFGARSITLLELI